MMQLLGRSKRVGCLIGLLASTAPAWGQELAQNGASARGGSSASPQTEGASSVDAGDIIVTARRRAEAQQSVPITITALSATTLARQNVTDTIALSRSTPSLNITRSASGGNSTYVLLRGLGGVEALPGQDQIVGVYVDEVPQARQEGGNLPFFDLSNVQVLYGPQGTLFGRNSVAGAILYQTQRPTDKLEGNVEVELGNYRQRWLTGMLNVPIAEGLALRVAGQIRRRRGYIQEVNSGTGLGSQHSESWRASLRWQPSDKLTSDVILSGFHADETQLGGAVFGAKAITGPTCAFNIANPAPSFANAACYYGPGAPVPRFLAAIGQLPPSAVAAYASYPSVSQSIADNLAAGTQGIALSFIPRAVDKSFAATNINAYELSDAVTLRAILGYRQVSSRQRQSGVGMEAPAFEINGSLNSRQYSGELQLQGQVLDDQLQFTTGVFYFREKSESFSGALAFGYDPNSQPFSTSGGTAINTSYSGYAQTTFRPSGFDRFSLTTGARYTWDKRELEVRSGGYLQNGLQLGTQTSCSLIDPNSSTGATLPLANCRLSNAAKYNVPTWLITADYKVLDETLVYATYSRGYRSGGFNVRSLFTPRSFRPEKADNFEVGVKSVLRVGDASIRFNADHWWLKYRDIQSVAVVSLPGPPFTATDIINSNSLKLHGFEIDASIEPIRGLTLRSFVGHVQGKYDEFLAGGLTLTDLPFGAAKWSWGANASYIHDLGDIGTLDLSANFSERSGALNSVVPSTDQVRSPTLASANFRVALSDIGGTGFGVAGYVRNVGDAARQITVPGTNLVTGGAGVNFTEPTFYGFDISYRF
jgi:iron complex outermembrane receptor protein